MQVGVTAGRRGAALCGLLERAGAQVIWGPTVVLVPAPTSSMRSATVTLLEAKPRAFGITTADGLRGWLGALATRDALTSTLRSTPVFTRGDKTASALASMGITPAHTPALRISDLANDILDSTLSGDTVAIQVDASGSPELARALREAHRSVHVIRPARASLPSDTTGAELLLGRLLSGELDILTFTSSPAVTNLFRLASELGLDTETVDSMHRTIVASIGPSTSEALAAIGVHYPIEPQTSRAAALVAALSANVANSIRPAIRLDPDKRCVASAGKSITLPSREFALMVSLFRRGVGVVAPDTLIADVWGTDGDRRRLEVLISRLRRRLAEIGFDIRAVPKRGYELRKGSQVCQTNTLS